MLGEGALIVPVQRNTTVERKGINPSLKLYFFKKIERKRR